MRLINYIIKLLFFVFRLKEIIFEFIIKNLNNN